METPQRFAAMPADLVVHVGQVHGEMVIELELGFATLNDVFLAAAYRALASSGHWDGTSGLRICVTVLPAEDVARPVRDQGVLVHATSAD